MFISIILTVCGSTIIIIIIITIISIVTIWISIFIITQVLMRTLEDIFGKKRKIIYNLPSLVVVGYQKIVDADDEGFSRFKMKRRHTNG